MTKKRATAVKAKRPSQSRGQLDSEMVKLLLQIQEDVRAIRERLERAATEPVR